MKGPGEATGSKRERLALLFALAAAAAGVLNLFLGLSRDQILFDWDFAKFYQAPLLLARLGTFTWMGARPVALIISAIPFTVAGAESPAFLFLPVAIICVALTFYFFLAKNILRSATGAAVACAVLVFAHVVTFSARFCVPYALSIAFAIFAAAAFRMGKNRLTVFLLALGLLSHPSTIFLLASWFLYGFASACAAAPRWKSLREFFLRSLGDAAILAGVILCFDLVIRLSRFAVPYGGDISGAGIVPAELAKLFPSIAGGIAGIAKHFPEWLRILLSNSDAGGMNESLLREMAGYFSIATSTSFGKQSLLAGLIFYPRILLLVENPLISFLAVSGAVPFLVKLARGRDEYGSSRRLDPAASIYILFGILPTILIILNSARGGIAVYRAAMTFYPALVLGALWTIREFALPRLERMAERSGKPVKNIALLSFLFLLCGTGFYFNSNLYYSRTPYAAILDTIKRGNTDSVYVFSTHRVLWELLVRDIAGKKLALVNSRKEAAALPPPSGRNALVICEYADTLLARSIDLRSWRRAGMYHNTFNWYGTFRRTDEVFTWDKLWDVGRRYPGNRVTSLYR